MSGDAGARFCRECDKQVYNFSLMTRGEIESLVAGSGGRVCARFTRRPDGTLETADSLSGTPRARRRAPLAVGAALGAAVSLCANAFAQAPATKAATEAAAHAPGREGARQEGAPSRETAALRGTIYDITGAVIPRASVVLIDEATKQELATTTDEEGVYRFANVGAGSYTLTAQSPGFTTFRKPQLRLKAGKEVRLDATLQIGALMGELVFVKDDGARHKVSHVLSSPYRALRRIIGKSR